MEAPVAMAPEDVGTHLQALRDEIEQEWLQFRRRTDEAALQQFRFQEQAFARCLERVAGDATRGGKVGAEAQAGADVISLSGKPNGSTHVQLIEAPTPWVKGTRVALGDVAGGAENGHAARGAECERLDEQIWKSATQGHAVLVQDVADAVRSSLLPLEASVQRLETVMAQQDARPSWTSPVDSVASTVDPKPILLKSGSGQSDVTSPETPKTTGSSKSDSLFSEASYADMLSSSQRWANERSLWHRHMSASGFMDWWSRLQEPPRTGWLAAVVCSKHFETLCACVIITNALLSWYAVNNEISNLQTKPTMFVEVSEYAFVSFYTIELALKLIVHRLYYFCNSEMQWNIFDFALVMFSLVDQYLTLAMQSSSGGTDFTFMRTLRILKMARVLRGLRVLRFFNELRLMLNSLIGSLASLFWSIAMLTLIFYIFGLVFTQGVANFLLDIAQADDGDLSAEEVRKLAKKFGSVEVTILSLYQAVTGGDDWQNFFALLEPTGLLYSALFIFFIAFSQIALLNILTAIFVQRAIKLAQPDRETQALENRSREIQEYEELRRLLHTIDVKHTGTLTRHDFAWHVKRGKLGAQLSILGLEVKDAALYFALVTSGLDGNEIDIDIFVDRSMKMRGHASCIDLLSLNFQLQNVLRAQSELQKQLAAVLHSQGRPALSAPPTKPRDDSRDDLRNELLSGERLSM